MFYCCSEEPVWGTSLHHTGFFSRPRCMRLFTKTREGLERASLNPTLVRIRTDGQRRKAWVSRCKSEIIESWAGGRKPRSMETLSSGGRSRRCEQCEPHKHTGGGTTTGGQMSTVWVTWALDWEESHMWTPQLPPSVWPWVSHLASIFLIYTMKKKYKPSEFVFLKLFSLNEIT